MSAMRIGVLVLLVSAAAWAQPVNVHFTSETSAIPGNQAGDTAVLRDPWGQWRDTLYGTDSTNNGFYAFLVDGGTAFATGFGAVGGVDARQPMLALPEASVGGLVAVSATTSGELLFFTTTDDAGILGIGGLSRVSTLAPGAVTLGDFGDAGAFVFLSTQAPLMPWWQLTEDGGALVTTSKPSLLLPDPPTALASSASTRRVYASIGIGGVVEIDPLADPPTVIQVVDAGSSGEIVGGLATYPQRDGGSLLLTSVPARNLFRVYSVQPGTPAEHLVDFTVSDVDGGRKILGASALDVWPGPFGGTDDQPVFDAGVIVICDRLGATGANYKLVSWAALARAANPPLPIDLPVFTPPIQVRPVGVPAQLALATSRGPVDLSFWPGNDTLVTTIDGVSLLSPRDLRPLRGLPDGGLGDGGVTDGGRPDAGLADGGRADAGVSDAGTAPVSVAVTVSALGRLDAFASVAPGGLLAVGSSTGFGGSTSISMRATDGGLQTLLTVPTSATRSVQLADLADAGVWLFAADGVLLHRYELDVADGGLRATPGADIDFPETVVSVTAWSAARRLFVSTTRSVYELDPLATPSTKRIVTGGAGLSALTLYPQRDGGAMLLGATNDRVRVIRTNDGTSLLEFQVIALDRVNLVGGIGWLDVTNEPVGADAGLRDGGVRWPFGVLALGVNANDAGSVVLVDWAQLARAATPPLPTDTVSVVRAGGAAGGGMAGGSVVMGGGTSNRSGGSAGGSAGGGEEPPPGCCTGAPSASVLPAMAFLLWLRRFARRSTK